MPLFLLLTPIIAASAMLPLAIEEEKKEKQVNELCLKKYEKPEQIKTCKDVLLNRTGENNAR